MSGNTSAFAPDEPPEINVHSHDRYHAVMKACASMPPLPTAVVHAVDFATLQAVDDAVKENLINPILIGFEDKIKSVAAEHKIDVSKYEIVNTKSSVESGVKAAEFAAAGKVHAIMKGSLHTDEVLGPIVSSTSGLRTGRRISHSFINDSPNYHKWIFVTDAVVNIAPDLTTKADICRNAADLWRAFTGEDRLPKIAVLGAVEVVNPKMQATLDAAALCKMADRGQITGCIIDGPLAFDNAINKEAAQQKGIKSEVAGDADILVCPEIEAANILAKQFMFITKTDTAGIITGAKIPVILGSRADSLRTRLLSCAAAVLVQARREGRK